jgi:hypothetical protein
LHDGILVLSDSVSVSPDPTRFAMTLRRHSWAWLVQLKRRLNVEVQIVDARGYPLLPDQAVPAVLHRPEVLAVIEQAAHSGQLKSVDVPQMHAICAALALHGATGGVLLVSRELAAASDNRSDAVHELGLLTSWLRASIEVQLSTEPAPSGEPYSRLAALRRALSAPEAVSSELGMVRIFAQALAIWEDIEVHAYIQDRGGIFVRRVSPPGQNLTVMPDVLPSDLVPRTRDLTRLSLQTAQQLDIRSVDDTFAAFVGGPSEGPSWFLVLSGVASVAEDRIAVYVDFLRQSLESATVERILQLHHAMWRHLLADNGQIERVAGAALEEIRTAVRADTAALVVTLPRGGAAFVAGEPSAFAEGRPLSTGNSLKVHRTLTNRGSIVVAVGRKGIAEFTPGETRILESAIETLLPWATGVLRRPEYQTERRAAARTFDDTLDDVAAHATALGTGVSVLVIRLADTLFSPRLTHDVAAWVKSHLRALETAGTLTEGEVAALLYDTTPEQASAVVARLRRVANEGDVGDALRSAAIEVAHCPPGVAYRPSVLAVARERAAHRSGVSPTIQ